MADEPRTRDLRSILLLSAVMGTILFFYAAAHPPVLGDVYEYAVVARNIVFSGEMREDFLRSYLDPAIPLPHPAAQRANLYPFLLIPFLLIFGESYLAVFLPCLLSYMLLGPAVYLVGTRLFGRFAGYFSAIFVLLHPRIFKHIVFDPHPEVLLTLLVLLSVYFFSLRRYAYWGLLTALAFMTKQNAGILFPVFGLWFLLYRREDWRDRGLWLGLLAILLVTGPFAVRNTILFGNPVYNETLTDMTSWSAERLRTGNMLEFLFRFREVPEEEFRIFPSTLEGARNLLASTWENTTRTLFGGYLIEYFPGFFELMYLPLLPFFLLSLRQPSGRTAARLCVWVTIAFLLFHILLMKGFEDRYLFPALPLVFLVSLRTLRDRCRGKGWLRPSFLAAFVLVTECGPGFVANGAGVVFAEARGREAYVELREAGRWIRENTEKDAVVLSSYFFSVSFYAGRCSVPYPYEDVEGLQRVLRHYGVDYILLCDIEGQDSHVHFPRLDFLERVFLGKTLALYEVIHERRLPDSAGDAQAYISDFNPLDEIFLRSPQHLRGTGHEIPHFRLDSPLYRYFVRFGGGCLWGSVEYGMLFWICAFFCRRSPHFLPNLFVCIAAVVAALFLLFFFDHGGKPPQVTYNQDVQLKRFLERRLDTENLGVTLILPSGENPLEDLLRARFEETRVVQSFPDPAEDRIILLPLDRAPPLLDGAAALAAAREAEHERDRRYEEFQRYFENLGFGTERLSHVFIAFPPDRLR